MPEFTENPVCPSCGTTFNRHEVERQLRQQSPFLFDAAIWTTKFRCVRCGGALTVSGHGRPDPTDR